MSEISRRRLRPHHHVAAVLSAGGVVILTWWWVGSHADDQRTLAATSPVALDGPSDLLKPHSAFADGDHSPANAVITAPSITDPVRPELVGQPAPSDEFRAQLLGSWADEFYGKRTFTFRDDGTATMELELDSVGKLLYGPKLTFFVAWELKEDVLSLKMTGGEPAGTAVTLAKLFGESSEQRIEKMSDSEMQLRSLDSNKLYTHQRVKTGQ